MASGLARRGIHVVASSDPEYHDAIAALSNGRAWLVGERYDENGSKHAAIAVGVARPNGDVGHIRIGQDYYTSVLRDYRDWKERWWREAIQNAVDAGATKITCVVLKQDDGTVLVQCVDDGRGMDRETILEKFLVLGGTTKRSYAATGESTAGGFGKAKELLLLPWIGWQVKSRDVVVVGQGGTYEVKDAGPYSHDGTIINAHMPADQCTDAAAALAYIGKCNLPGVTFVVEDEDGPRTVKAGLRTGKEIRSFDEKATLYQNKSASFRSVMLVRVKGLHMFTRYVPSEVEGTLILELTRPSVELLTANRDGFADESIGYAIDRFVNELSADVRSAMKAKKGMIRQKYRGTGLFTPTDKEIAEAAVSRALGRKLSRGGGKAFVIDADDAQALTESMPESPVDEVEMSLAPSADAIRAMTSGLLVSGQAHIEAIAKQSAWQPDFFVVNEAEGYHVPNKLKPGTMAPGVVKLAKLWAEFCRFVLIQLGSAESYGVGWTISRDALAAYTRDEGAHWLLLNPFKNGDVGGELLSVSDKEDVAWLYAAAIHEVTHMADGVTYHNESFASAMTKNVARCANKWRQVEAIRKAVVARRTQRRSVEEGTVREQEKPKQPEPEESWRFPFYFAPLHTHHIVPYTVILERLVSRYRERRLDTLTEKLMSYYGSSFGTKHNPAHMIIGDYVEQLIDEGHVVREEYGHLELTSRGQDALNWLQENVRIELGMIPSSAMLGVVVSLAFSGMQNLQDLFDRYPGQEELIRAALADLVAAELVRMDVDLKQDSASPSAWEVSPRYLLDWDKAMQVARWFV
jgi:hypothetical protein